MGIKYVPHSSLNPKFTGLNAGGGCGGRAVDVYVVLPGTWASEAAIEALLPAARADAGIE
jgi:hypothetical protein